MRLELDVKTLVVGIALGVILTVALGAAGGSADKADFGIAIENKGTALVKAQDGSFYIVDSQSTEAKRVEYKSGGLREKYFKLSGPEQSVK